jgi:hypothetical protein
MICMTTKKPNCTTLGGGGGISGGCYSKNRPTVVCKTILYHEVIWCFSTKKKKNQSLPSFFSLLVPELI